MNNSGKAKLITSVHHFEKFSELGIPIYYFKVPGTAGRKTSRRRKRRRAQASTKRYVFHTNAVRIIQYRHIILDLLLEILLSNVKKYLLKVRNHEDSGPCKMCKMEFLVKKKLTADTAIHVFCKVLHIRGSSTRSPKSASH